MATMSSEVLITVANNAPETIGGQRFDDVVGKEYAKWTLELAKQFIWRLLQQENNPSDRKSYNEVDLIVKILTNGKNVEVNKNQIYLDATYMGTYEPSDLKREVSGLLFYAMGLVWQWNGKGKAREGLIQGMANYGRLKAQYDPSEWKKAGDGERWDEGKEVTARFLAYCEGLKVGFVADLNKLMKDGYTDDYFTRLLGNPVGQLWKDYKAQYGN